MNEESQILKTDALGRVTVPKAKREEMLDAFEASSMSGAAFARNHGIPAMTFASWIQKRRKARGDYNNEQTRRKLRMGKGSKKKSSPKSQSMNLIEVEVSPPPASISPLIVNLSNGAKVEVSDPSQIPLLKALMDELTC